MAKASRNSEPTLSVTVRGKAITPAIIAAYSKRLGSIDDVITVFANAAALQAGIHNNRNWLDKLFSMPLMTLKSGKLSKTGKEVLSYIQAYFPRAVWNSTNDQLGLTKKREGSPLECHFLAFGATDEQIKANGTSIVTLGEGDKAALYYPHGDFLLSFTEFKNAEKVKNEPKEPEAPSMTAKSFVVQAEKALACFKAERLVGTPEELFAAAAHAKALFMALDAAHTAALDAKLAKMQDAGTAHTLSDELDLARVDMANGTISKKSKQAPGPKAAKAANLAGAVA